MRREMLIISRLTSGCVRALKARTRPLFFPSDPLRSQADSSMFLPDT